jgi:hypothetical protein
MKNEELIAKIKSGHMKRSDLAKIRFNAQKKLASGDIFAAQVVQAIDEACPLEMEYVFMGFCPGADFKKRQDIHWKNEGICEFLYYESKPQANRFNKVAPGDLIILKKRQIFGKTMALYGHGRVKAICFNDDNIKYLKMDWSKQDQIIEVPLLGANSTIDVKSSSDIAKHMPDEFFEWLKG